jgi:hypothetical protein
MASFLLPSITMATVAKAKIKDNPCNIQIKHHQAKARSAAKMY